MWRRGGEGVQKSENLADVINGCFLMAFSSACFSALIRSTMFLKEEKGTVKYLNKTYLQTTKQCSSQLL